MQGCKTKVNMENSTQFGWDLIWSTHHGVMILISLRICQEIFWNCQFMGNLWKGTSVKILSCKEILSLYFVVQILYILDLLLVFSVSLEVLSCGLLQPEILNSCIDTSCPPSPVRATVSPYFESKILVINFGELFSDYFDRGGFLLILHTDQRKP